MSFAFLIADAGDAPSACWLPSVEAALPFAGGTHSTWAGGGFEFHGWTAAGESLQLDGWHDDAEGAACFSGYGLSANGALMTAVSLAGTADAAEARALYHGEWTAAVRRPDGRIWVGSAASGGAHLYATTVGSPVLLSNRARLLWAALRALGRPPTPDWMALSWLLNAGWVLEPRRTAVREVELVPANETVEIEPLAARVCRRSLGELEFLDRPQRAREPIDFSNLSRRLVGNLHWLAEGNGDFAAGLTGGKDSRLVAAAIREAGLLPRCRFYTLGREGDAELVAARGVAAALGAETRLQAPSEIGDLHFALRRHVALSEGTLNAWDLKGWATNSGGLELHGLFGEVYRRKSAAVTPDSEAFARARDVGRNDLFGLLEPAYQRDQEARLAGWLERLLDAGLPLELAEDVFYLRLRYPRWAGQARQADALAGPRIQPLLHPELVDAYYRLTIEDRSLERMHYELLADLAPDLIPLPFAVRGWKHGLAGRRASGGPPLSTPPLTGTHRVGLGWQVPALRRQRQWWREWILDRSGELAPLTARYRLERHVDLTEVAVTGRPTLRSLRHGLRQPRLLRLGRARPSVAVTATLGLMTILALLDDLREMPLAERPGDA